MSSFEEFMDEVKKSLKNALPASNTTLSEIQSDLATTIQSHLAPLEIASEEQRRFSDKVSSLIQDQAFLSEFNEQIGEPLEHESEDEFVKRGSETLRQMLYKKFNIKS